MTTLREAAQQALAALEVATNCLDGYYIPRGKTTLPEIEDAITALKAALAEPVQDERTTIADLRCAKWLDPECADKGACQSLKFKRSAEPVQEPAPAPAPMPPFPPVSQWKRGCAVCGLGADGEAYGYACPRSDCPTRVTCGGVV